MGKLADLYLKKFQDRNLLRAETFSLMIAYVEQRVAARGFGYIVETGTARVKDNWADGQSTLIWDWLVGEMRGELFAVSIDINPEAIAVASSQTNLVRYVTGDSVEALKAMQSKMFRTWLLYLDSFDWSEENAEASAAHHLKELQAVWEFLPSGCLIVVDDRHADTAGKHVAVERFLTEQGVKPFFKGYQIGWIKP